MAQYRKATETKRAVGTDDNLKELPSGMVPPDKPNTERDVTKDKLEEATAAEAQ